MGDPEDVMDLDSALRIGLQFLARVKLSAPHFFLAVR